MSSNPSSGAAKYSLQIRESAAKELEALGAKKDRRKIVTRIHSLSADPRPAGSEKLAGQENLYRVRQGSYRIVYSIDDSRKVVLITKIGDRKEVYR